VTKPEQEPAGDYGYDLAHEQAGRGATPAKRPDDHRHGQPAHAGGKDDRHEDFGYDEAHDF
jgi:hypothetical protein